jgi:Uncharacterized conserved protein
MVSHLVADNKFRPYDCVRERLTNLRSSSETISALTKKSSTAYAACAGDFVRATRVARSVRRDLEIASRRIR